MNERLKDPSMISLENEFVALKQTYEKLAVEHDLTDGLFRSELKYRLELLSLVNMIQKHLEEGWPATDTLELIKNFWSKRDESRSNTQNS